MNTLVFCLSCLITSIQDPTEEELFGQTLTSVQVQLKRNTALDQYHSADFYYYNEQRKPIGLVLLPKVAFNAGQKFLDEKIISDAKNITETNEYTVIEYDPQTANLEFMFDKLHQLKSFGVLPMVVYEEKECVLVSNKIILETKPSVALNLLKERLLKFGKFKLISIESSEMEIDDRAAQVYEIIINKLESPSNIFVLANLIAEDDIYFKWARPKFEPLNPPISATMYITAPGLPTLGDKRILHLDIQIYDLAINLIKDLVPQLGEGEFVPNIPQFNDAWFWADKPVITEITKGFVRIISYDWPFMFLDASASSPRPIQDKIPFIEIKGIKLVYTQKMGDKVVEKLHFVEGPVFQIGSVIEKALSPINDIQPIHDYKVQRVSAQNNSQQINSERQNTFLLVYNWLSQQGLDVAGISVLVASMLLYFNLIIPSIIFAVAIREKRKMKKDIRGDWDSLVNFPDLLDDSIESIDVVDNWKDIYGLIARRLKFILSKYFNLDQMIYSEDVTEYYPLHLKNILWELEKVYRGEEKPDCEDIIWLREEINLFVNFYSQKKAL